MELKSPAFAHGMKIPPLYTCNGKDVCPELQIEDVPNEAKSLILIMDDPDVPKSVREDQMWVHLVLFNIPKETKRIPSGKTFPGILGKNTGGTLGYQGPCPPDREHRYFFKLYALDLFLSLPEGSTKEEVEKAMEGHILAKAELIGMYSVLK